MSKLIFTTEDFHGGPYNYQPSVMTYMATKAQQVFDKWLSEQKVVYITDDKHGNFFGGYRKNDTDSYKAYLVNIEPIEQCKHPPGKITELWPDNGFTSFYLCECGKKMKANTFVIAEDCNHLKTKMWEPHLAGARKCLDCNMVYNPNFNSRWHHEQQKA